MAGDPYVQWCGRGRTIVPLSRFWLATATPLWGGCLILKRDQSDRWARQSSDRRYNPMHNMTWQLRPVLSMERFCPIISMAPVLAIV
jgi:hypothetical protein